MNEPLNQPCPQCKRGDVVERRNKKTGQPFYGCSRYPDCRFAVADLARLAPSVLATAPAAPTLANGDLELVSALRDLAEAITSLARELKLGTGLSPSDGPESRVQS